MKEKANIWNLRHHHHPTIAPPDYWKQGRGILGGENERKLLWKFTPVQ